ncbi:AsmA-like C-terminal domain-containing protein [Desulfobacterota bacterium M19]
MKKHLVFLTVAVVIFCGILLSPLLLKYSGVKQRINAQLTVLLGSNAGIGNIDWRWLPVPALRVENLTSENDIYALRVPEVLIYPDWRVIFNRQLSLGRVTFINPKLIIKRFAFHEKRPVLPNLKLTVKNGRLLLPAGKLTPEITLRRLSFNKLRLRVISHEQRLKISLDAAASFASEVNIQARVDLNKRYLSLDLGVENFNLAACFSRLYGAGSLTATDIPLRLHAEVMGSHDWQAGIAVDAPCTLPVPGFLCKLRRLNNLKITRKGDDYFVDIDKLVLGDPALELGGSIYRRKGIWQIDLKGRNLDLAAIRRIILARFGKNEVAAKVCKIVEGGHARSARYTFNGPLSDFKHINKMTVAVDVDRAPIFIPDINLHLDWASGPITIINGQLAGKGLTAAIGGSRGKNGNLILDLPEEDKAFKLVLDIDADLSDLSRILKTVVHNRPFQDELAHFKDIRGRAQGTLRLGDDLDNLQTRVVVKNMRASGRYDRLPWPFKIQGGQLEIAPKRVSWEGLSCILGPHDIKESGGFVSWGGGREPVLNINSLRAEVDLADLWQNSYLDTGGKRNFLKQVLAADISSVSGTLRLREGSLKGPVTRPSAWQYTARGSVGNFHLTARHLPELVSSALDGKLTDHGAAVSGIFKVAGEKIYLDGNYRHHHLRNWQGTTTLNGQVSRRLGPWLKGLDWIPPRFFPRLPCRLKGLSLINNDAAWDDFRIKGRVLAGSQGAGVAPELDLDIIDNPKALLMTFKMADGLRQGRLTYNKWRTPARSVLTWHGKLRLQTLNDFLAWNFFDRGTVSGSFNMLAQHSNGLSAAFNGAMSFADVSLEDKDESMPLTVKQIYIAGDNRRMKIKGVEIKLGADTLRGHGFLTTNGSNYKLNMAVTAKKLAWHNLGQALNIIKKRLSPEVSAGKTKIREHIIPPNLSGGLDFALGSFLYQKKPAAHDNNSKPHIYTWSPVRGRINFKSRSTVVDLDSASICGMDMSGRWDITRPMDSVFKIDSPGQVFKFDKTLPCLGVKQSLIEGPFSLDAELKGIPGNWSGGHINLQSAHGLIRRMDLLSRIFTVINFTDLLTWDNKSTSGHEGLEYNKMDIKTSIKNNVVTLKRLVLKGKGVNLSGRGTIILPTRRVDLTFFVAPLKMIDSVVTSIPLVGRALGGKKGSILTFPVAVKGPLADPEVTALPPGAVGKAAMEFVIDTLTLPFRILSPLLPAEKTDKGK